MPSLQISACTFRRPEGLQALFASLAQLVRPDGVEVSVCVVDNDTVPSAEALVMQLGAGLDMPVHYVHEPRPGIPMARNRVLEAAAEVDYVAFIDDDETAEPGWLVALWDMACQSGAHFVQGPVVMTVEDADDRWWLDTVFFRQRSFPDGAARRESWTNNVLVDMAFIRDRAIRFDERLALDGGEDTLFFQDMVRAGGRGVFATAARVREVQPAQRLRWSWGMQRQYRNGISRANTMLLRRAWPVTLVYCLVRGAGMAVIGLAQLIRLPIHGRRAVADSLGLLCRCGGILMGAVGVRHLEYARAVAPEQDSRVPPSAGNSP